MKKIGLTGIIGSGKTTAALYFKGLGVPVFIADDCAKELMENDDNLKNQIIKLLGDSAYVNDKLNYCFSLNSTSSQTDLGKMIKDSK